MIYSTIFNLIKRNIKPIYILLGFSILLNIFTCRSCMKYKNYNTESTVVERAYQRVLLTNEVYVTNIIYKYKSYHLTNFSREVYSDAKITHISNFIYDYIH